jgi:hypothetical protein
VNVNSDRNDLLFGWDYANLPRVTAVADCRNAATLLSDTNPEPITLNPNQTTTLTLRLQNSGTCTWSSDYTLISTYSQPLPLPLQTFPGDTLDLQLTLTAPPQPGLYQRQTLLQAPSGERFAFGPTNSDPLTIPLTVTP